MKTTSVLLTGVSGVLVASALVASALVGPAASAPSATAGKDPCVASEVARTVGKTVYNVGDYLDSHPETNQVVTTVVQQPPNAQSVGVLKSYFDAHPKVQDDLAKTTEPLAELTDKCKLAISLPQVLGLLQAAQGQGGPAALTQPVAVR